MISSTSHDGFPQTVGTVSYLARVISSTERQEAREEIVLGMLVM